MAIINPDGLFRGQRLRKCSDRARLYWPYLFLASNGFGRLELDYEYLVPHVFLGFRNPPTAQEIESCIMEYTDAGLGFLYHDGQWFQWDTPTKLLPRWKTSVDKNSPTPDSKELQKFSENLRKLPSGGGVGVGIGVGVGVRGGIGVGVGEKTQPPVETSSNKEKSKPKKSNLHEMPVVGPTDERRRELAAQLENLRSAGIN